ncbi:MAG: ribonuclease H, partial [Chlorobi bacterium]|nr:ribonuclease H [Chlorobiota bacterium]
MAKYKYYVVWKGRKTGIFDSWAECSNAISGYEGARYKGFVNKAEAEYALAHPSSVRGSGKKTTAGNGGSIVWESLSVDAACSGNPGPMEYRGVHTKTKQVIFHKKHRL